MVKKKKLPLRKCIVTKEMRPKQELIRVVRTKEGKVFVDDTGKQNGRGAYVTKDLSVIEQAIKSKALNQQFKQNINKEVYEHLKQMVTGTLNE